MLAALIAAAAVVGVTLLQTRGEITTVPDSVTQARKGRPILQLELGVRSDAEARALVRAEALFDREHHAGQAAAIFRRYHSVDAQLGLALTTWQGPSSLGAVTKIAAAHANDPAALLNLGWADYQAGRNADAAAAWRRVAARFADSPYGVDAEDALHGGPPGLPPIVTGLALPKSIANLPAAAQVAALRRAAAGRDVQAKLLYGTVLWNGLRMPISAEKQFAAAARLAPHNAVARATAAVASLLEGEPDARLRAARPAHCSLSALGRDRVPPRRASRLHRQVREGGEATPRVRHGRPAFTLRTRRKDLAREYGSY